MPRPPPRRSRPPPRPAPAGATSPTAPATTAAIATTPATTAAAPATATAPATSAPATTAPAALGGQLSFLVFGEPAEFEGLLRRGPGPHGREPRRHNQHRLGAVEPDHLVKLSTALAAGDPPDVWVIDYRRFGLLQNAGVIDPAGPHLDQSNIIHATDFYTAPMQPFTVNGQLQCIPLNMSSLEVYYNKDLFDKAGLAYPKMGWTWTEFVHDALAITQLTRPTRRSTAWASTRS